MSFGMVIRTELDPEESTCRRSKPGRCSAIGLPMLLLSETRCIASRRGNASSSFEPAWKSGQASNICGSVSSGRFWRTDRWSAGANGPTRCPACGTESASGNTKAAAGPESMRPLSTSTTRGQGREAAVLLSLAIAAAAPREGFCDASASIPRPDGRPTWFVVASAASQSGRGPISHTAFRCAASERMEHATGSICPTGVTTGIFRRLSPWLLWRPPPIFRSDRLPFAFEAGGLNTYRLSVGSI
jgi:hypothetical protein